MILVRTSCYCDSCIVVIFLTLIVSFTWVSFIRWLSIVIRRFLLLPLFRDLLSSNIDS